MEGGNVTVKWNPDEVIISCDDKEIVILHHQADDLRNILHHIHNIHSDCEAYCGEIIGVPR